MEQFSAAQLVRTYSIEVEKKLPPEVPPHDLRRVLVDGERKLMDHEYELQHWRKYYEPWEPLKGEIDPTTKALQTRAVELSHAWKTFRQTLPENERDEIENTVPSVQNLIEMVETTTEFETKKAKSKRGKFMNYFTRFCGTLDAHSTMLQVIPDDRYLCLFTGTLKTIINASSNYEKMAKGIGGALSRISINVVACQKEVALYKTKALQEMVSNLYAHVFLYLQDTMDWYLKKSRNRLRDAFNESFYDHFEETILSIENISSGILREVGLSAMAEIRQVKSTTDFLAQSQSSSRVALHGIERELENSKYRDEQLRLEIEHDRKERAQLALHNAEQLERMKTLLSNVFTGVRYELVAVAGRPTQNVKMISGGVDDLAVTGMENHPVRSYQRDDIAFDSNRLLDMFDKDRIAPRCDSSTPLTIDVTASSHLMEWTTEKSSRVLSIAGRKPNALELAPMTVLASLCINFAITSELPVISYFCKLSREDPRSGNTLESQELIGLTYSLIRQLIENLPPAFDCEYDFSKQRLDSLDGTLESWNVAIELLTGLIKLAPTPLFCIIDGFQALDDRSTEGFLEEFVKVLRGPVQPSSTGLKVLFTTTGRSRCLLGILSRTELVLADRDGAKDGPVRRAGHARFTFM